VYVTHAGRTTPFPPRRRRHQARRDYSQRYRSFLREANLRVVDPTTRRTVLSDFIGAVQTADGSLSLNAAAIC